MDKKASWIIILGILLIPQFLAAQTWSPSKRLTWNPGDSTGAVVAIGTDDSIHVVWRDTSPGNLEIFYRSSPDGGINWVATKRLTWNSSWSGYPKMAVDSSNDIHMVWEESISNNHEIFYKNRK